MRDYDAPVFAEGMRRKATLKPDEGTAMLRLRLRLSKLGWGSKRLAQEFGCSRTKVQRSAGDGSLYQRRRPIWRLGWSRSVAS
jgi:hypothetical protein